MTTTALTHKNVLTIYMDNENEANVMLFTVNRLFV
jgi:hypothetical protein